MRFGRLNPDLECQRYQVLHLGNCKSLGFPFENAGVPSQTLAKNKGADKSAH